MSPTIRRKYKYFHSTVQRAKDRRQKFHFCRLTYDHITSNLISLLLNPFICDVFAAVVVCARSLLSWYIKSHDVDLSVFCLLLYL